MTCKILKIIFLFLFLSNCNQTNLKTYKIEYPDKTKYSNLGFALIYNDNLDGLKKMDNNSLYIYHKFLKKKSRVKIINPVNGKSLIASVKSNSENFSGFYNSVLSLRIAENLDLDLDDPYIEIISISNNKTYIAKKTKTFEEEKNVAEKAPIDGVLISDLNKKLKKKKTVKKKNFSYSIKVADFYYLDSAKMLIDRIKKNSSVRNVKIVKISDVKYRVLIGPFNDIKDIKIAFEQIMSLDFENLEILKNV